MNLAGVNVSELAKIAPWIFAIIVVIAGLISIGVTFVTKSVSRVLGMALFSVAAYMWFRGRITPQIATVMLIVGGFLAITNVGHEFMLEFYRDLGAVPGGA